MTNKKNILSIPNWKDGINSLGHLQKVLNKNVKKVFECEGKCKDRFVDGITLACRKCIKRFAITSFLTEKQQKEILKILKENL